MARPLRLAAPAGRCTRSASTSRRRYTLPEGRPEHEPHAELARARRARASPSAPHAGGSSSRAARAAVSPRPGIYELVDQLGGSPPRPRGRRAAARAAPARGRADRRAERRRGARAAAAPPGRHGAAEGRLEAPSSPTRRRALEDALAELERRLRADAGRARRHGRVGAARTSAATCPRLAGAHIPVDRRASKRRASRSACSRRDPLPERPGGDDPRGERRRGPAAQRRARPHRGRRSKALFDELGLFDVDEHPQGLRGRRLRRRARACRSRWRWRPACPAPFLIPDGSELFLGFTSTQKAGLGPPQDREHREARLRDSPGGYFRAGHAPAPLAHHRGPRGLVHQLPARRSASRRRSGPGSRSGRDAQTVPQGPNDVVGRRATCSATTARDGQIGHSGLAPDRVAPAATTAVGADGDASTPGHRDPAPRRLQHARQPVLLERRPDARRDEHRPGRRRPLRRLQPVERRLPPQPPGDGRRASRTGRSCRSSRATAARASTRSCAPLTARTSSSRRGGTARSRSSSCSRRAPRGQRVPMFWGYNPGLRDWF